MTHYIDTDRVLFGSPAYLPKPAMCGIQKFAKIIEATKHSKGPRNHCLQFVPFSIQSILAVANGQPDLLKQTDTKWLT